MQSPGNAKADDSGGAPRSFIAWLPSVFTYPIAGRGKYIILCGAAAFTGVGLLGHFLPKIAMIPGMLLTAYMAMYLLDIIGSCAGGGDEPPDWPDLRNVDDTVRPLLRVIGVFAITFGPAIVYRYAPWFLYAFTGWNAWVPVDWVYHALLIAGGVCLPMGLLCAALYGSLGILWPWRVLSGIVKVAPCYLLALAIMAAAAAMGLLALSYLGNVPLIGQAVTLYLVLAEGRILGLIYRTQAKRLGWFE